MKDKFFILRDQQNRRRNIIFYASNDTDTFSFLLQEIPEKFNGKNIIYECFINQTSEHFDTKLEAYDYIFSYIRDNINDNYQNLRNIDYDNEDPFMELYYRSLIIDKKYITKELIDIAREYELYFCISEKYNLYLTKNNVLNLPLDSDDEYEEENNNEEIKKFLEEDYKLSEEDDKFYIDNVYIFNYNILSMVEKEYKFTIMAE